MVIGAIVVNVCCASAILLFYCAGLISGIISNF